MTKITFYTVFTMATMLTLIHFTFNFYCCFCTFIIYWPVFYFKVGQRWIEWEFLLELESGRSFITLHTLSLSLTSELNGAVDKSGEVDSWSLGHRKHQHSVNRLVVGVWSEQSFSSVNHWTFRWLNTKSFHWQELLGSKSAMRCINSTN